MKRSLWKLPFFHPVFFKKRFLFKDNEILIKLRNSMIPEYFIGKSVKIYNGAWFLSKTIVNHMIGFKFGMFSFTKKSDTQLQNKKKKKKVKKK